MYNKELHAKAERMYDANYGNKLFFGGYGGERIREIHQDRDDNLNERLKNKSITIRILETRRLEIERIARKEGLTMSYIVDTILAKSIKEYNNWEYEEKEFKYKWLEQFDAISEEEQRQYLFDNIEGSVKSE